MTHDAKKTDVALKKYHDSLPVWERVRPEFRRDLAEWLDPEWKDHFISDAERALDFYNPDMDTIRKFEVWYGETVV